MPTYTTGFVENFSHTGKDQADSINHTLILLSVLANEKGNIEDKFSIDDIKDRIHFGCVIDQEMVALDQLEIKEDKRLKCCAHTILCVDECIDTFIGSVEATVEETNLLALQ